MNRRKLIIFGTGEVAEMAAYLFPLHTDYTIAAFCVDSAYLATDRFMEKPLVAFEDIRNTFPPSEHDMFIALGYARINHAREEKYHTAKQMGYHLASYISPLATIYDNVTWGDNCFIFENNVLQPYVKIGCDTIIWGGNYVAHHCTIGNHCFIASHAMIAGGVTIGDHCFIGVNSTLRDHIRIGNRCVIGAGALLLENAKDDQVFIATATPASPITSHDLKNI